MRNSDYRFISIKVLIDRIMGREIFKTLKIDNAIRWAKDCIELIDNPDFLVRETDKIYIESYRGKLPYNMIKCTQIRIIDSTTGRTSSSTTSIDPFLQDMNESDVTGVPHHLDYEFNGNFIITNTEDCTLAIAYTALPTDVDGYLMVPSNVKVVMAIESYIKFKQLEILNDFGLVDYGKVEKEEQNQMWYLGAAQSEKGWSNLDKSKTLINNISKLYPDRHSHERGYGNSTKRNI